VIVLRLEVNAASEEEIRPVYQGIDALLNRLLPDSRVTGRITIEDTDREICAERHVGEQRAADTAHPNHPAPWTSATSDGKAEA
jgi:hypothetical protein